MSERAGAGDLSTWFLCSICFLIHGYSFALFGSVVGRRWLSGVSYTCLSICSTPVPGLSCFVLGGYRLPLLVSRCLGLGLGEHIKKKANGQRVFLYISGSLPVFTKIRVSRLASESVLFLCPLAVRVSFATSCGGTHPLMSNCERNILPVKLSTDQSHARSRP